MISYNIGQVSHSITGFYHASFLEKFHNAIAMYLIQSIWVIKIVMPSHSVMLAVLLKARSKLKVPRSMRFTWPNWSSFNEMPLWCAFWRSIEHQYAHLFILLFFLKNVWKVKINHSILKEMTRTIDLLNNTILKVLYFTNNFLFTYQKTRTRINYYSSDFWSLSFGYILIKPYTSFWSYVPHLCIISKTLVQW